MRLSNVPLSILQLSFLPLSFLLSMQLHSNYRNYRSAGLRIVLLSLLLSISGCSISSDAGSAAALRLVTEKMAIAEMLAQYPYRWDSKNSSGVADLFTDDGVLERWQNGSLVENSRIVGKRAIYDYAKQSHEGRLADRQTRHNFSGLTFLELGGNSAVTENMVLITHQTANDNAPVIRSSGIYRISWLKTEQGWRITRRILFTDSLPSQ